MRTVHTLIASDPGRKLVIEPLTIICDEPTPDLDQVDDYRGVYQGAACRLLDALQKTVPGGLMDALLAELCHRRAVLLRVPMEARSEEPIAAVIQAAQAAKILGKRSEATHIGTDAVAWYAAVGRLLLAVEKLPQAREHLRDG